MDDISDFLNLQSPPALEPATLKSLESMDVQPIPIPAPDLTPILKLMQEGAINIPMWFKDPESMRAVVMIPMDIQSMTPFMTRQLWALMELNKERAPR